MKFVRLILLTFLLFTRPIRLLIVFGGITYYASCFDPVVVVDYLVVHCGAVQSGGINLIDLRRRSWLEIL